MAITETEFDTLLAEPGVPPPVAPATNVAVAPGGSMSEADFDAFVGTPDTGLSFAPTTPLTNNAFTLAHEDARARADSSRRKQMVGGLPVAPGEEMPFLENLAAEANLTAEGRIETWRKFYGPENVVVDADGDIFIRQTKAGGEKQLINVNKAGPSLADAARLSLMAIEVMASARGAKLAQAPATAGRITLGRQYANLGRQVAGGVAGSAASQALIASGGYGGEDDPVEAAKAIGVNAGVETVLGLGAGSALFYPRRALEWWTGNSGKAVKEMRGKLTERLSGTAMEETVPREEVGNALIDAISARGMRLRASREGAEANVGVAARSDVEGALTRGTGTPPMLSPEGLGEGLTARVVDARDKWKAADRTVFEAVRADPRAQAFTLDPQALVDDARKMAAGMTSVQRTLPTGAGTVTENVSGLNVAGILGKLESVASLEGGKVRLVDLMTARTAIGEAVAMGEAVPGTHTGAMKELYKKLTEAIDRGFVDLKAPDLQAKWKDATASYAKAAEFFEQPAFKRVFKEGPQAVSPEAVVKSLTEGTTAADTYRTFKQLLRPAELAQVKRAVADDLVGLNLDPTRTEIGAESLSRALKAFSQANPEMAEDVFGGELKGILATLDAASVATGKLKVTDLANGMSGTGPLTTRAVRDMLAAQAVENRALNNAIVKQAVAGTLDPTKVKGSQFMSGLIDAKPSDLREVMKDVADPALLQQWRQATTTDILESVMDPKTGAISQDKLLRELGVTTSDRALNLRTVLGTDAEEVLRRMATDSGFASHMSKFMKSVLPAAVAAPVPAWRYRYLTSKVVGNILSDDTFTRWMKDWRVGARPPRLFEVHIGTLIRQALDLPGTPTRDDATPAPTSP